MEKETKKTQSSFVATKRWLSPTVTVVSLDRDVVTASDNQRDVLVDDQDWGIIVD